MLKEDLKFITTELLRDTKKLSVRSANCCISEGLDNFYEILSFFENNGSFSKKKIKNAGRKTNEELDELCLSIIPKLKKTKKIDRRFNNEVVEVIQELKLDERKTLKSIAELIINYEKYIKEKSHILSYDLRNEIFSRAYNFCIRNGHFPMFWILEKHLKLKTSRNIKILISSIPVFENNKELTLTELAVKHNLTRERVRQIRIDAYKKTFEIDNSNINNKDNSEFIKYTELLQNRHDWNYILEELKYVNIITPYTPELDKVIDNEKCNFTFEFIVQIIAYIFRDTFTLFDGFDININRKTEKIPYLIRKEFTDIFDFKKFKEELEDHLLNNNFEYFLDVEDYIRNSMCWIKFNLEKTENIAAITKNILLNDYGLYSDNDDGKIKIPIGQNIEINDFVYEILKRNKKPMFLKEIFSEFKKLLPKHRYTLENNSEKLRPFLHRNNNITHIKRKSLFTLKEWRHFPKGTIRNRITEYLESNKTPQTVDSITKYVNLVFETTTNSVRSTMLSGRNFAQYENGLFGLKHKKYPSIYKRLSKNENSRKTFEQRLNDFEIFIVKNQHFPFSNSKNKEEESLYRWWNRIENGKQIMTEKQQSQVERINTQYQSSKIDKTTYIWILNLNKIKRFILENQRLPSSKGNEKPLYNLWMSIKSDFNSDRLNREQRKKYIELTKLI